jgi:hypothetical protein
VQQWHGGRGTFPGNLWTARRKGKFVRKDLTRNQVEQGVPKEQTHEKRLWKDPKGNSGMRRRDVKEPLDLMKGKKVTNTIGGWSRRQHLRPKSVGTANRNYWKTNGLEAVK